MMKLAVPASDELTVAGEPSTVGNSHSAVVAIVVAAVSSAVAVMAVARVVFSSMIT